MRVFFALSLTLMLSACAALLEEKAKQPEPPEEQPQWMLDNATIEAMTKNGGLIINWLNPEDAAAKMAPSTRASNDETVGQGGTPGTVNPITEEELQVWQEKWDALKHGMEPLPYIYRKAADLAVDYETDGAKVVYDWWWFDEADKTWKMKLTHEVAGVKLVVDRYWNNSSTTGWQHTLGGMVADNAQSDVAKWQSQAAAQTRFAGYKKLYQEIEKFRWEYLTYLGLNKLFFSGSMAETLMLDDSNPQKAPTLLLHEMDTYLRSNYVGDIGEDRLFINEGVYSGGRISEVYPPRPGGYSKRDSALQIDKYGKFLDAEKMLAGPIYVLQQDASLPSSHPESRNPKYSAPAAARGKLFEFYMGYVRGVEPSWWGGEEDVVIVLDDMDIYAGETKPVVMRTVPSDISLVGIEWLSSDTEIAGVTTDGKVIGVSEGDVTISVVFEGRKLASCKVRVTYDPDAIPVNKITLNKTTLEMFPGEVHDRLEASVTPPHATYSTVVWESDDEAIATVDADGKVTAVSVGTTHIIARAGGRMAECEVKVKFPTIILEDIVVHKGKTKLIPYTTSPPGETLINAVWESEIETIATVLSGAVTGVNEGETTITVTTAGSEPVSCTVTVLPPEPDNVAAESVAIYDANGAELKKLTLPAGDSYQLYAVVLPENADCNVVWISEKLEIATVDQTGLVTAAKKEGKVNIIAIANGMTAVCEVTVETVTVEPTTLTLKLGETSSTPLTATITPYNDPYEEAVWWSEDESIAIVDGATGEVTGLSAGVVRIYATGGESAYCTVTVKSDVDIAIAPKTLNLAPDEIYNKLEVTITPPDGIDAAYTFSSANSAIAMVDEFGVVTAMSDGTTKIYATTAEGLSDFCTVNVQGGLRDIESAPFNSDPGNRGVTITLTGGTFVEETSLSWSKFTLSTLGTPGFEPVLEGTLAGRPKRISDTEVFVPSDRVETAGSGQKMTVAAAAFATQSTSTAVTVKANIGLVLYFVSYVEGDNMLTFTLTGGTFVEQEKLSREQFDVLNTNDDGTGITDFDRCTITRKSDTEVIITGFIVSTDKIISDSRIIVYPEALATQATAVTIVAGVAE